MRERLNEKTAEAMFLQRLESEFHIAPRIGKSVLETAQESLLGDVETRVETGQIEVIVAGVGAAFGPKLRESERVRVRLTVDKGKEDREVRALLGAEGVRRGRILRVTEEALEQGGVLTQEDLAGVLQVDRRTIERDIQALRQAGHRVQTRGVLKNVGRGQTHKVKIIELWLRREGYDKIARWMHHSPQAIKRYVSTFLRMVVLVRQGKSAEEISFLTQSSAKVVTDYLGLYEAVQQQPAQCEKLEEEIARITLWQRAEGEKGGRKA
jgi:predicted transcriptional regulator